MSLVCVPIFIDDPSQSLPLCARALAAGADLVELRIDPYYTGLDDAEQIPAIESLVTACPLPCILTCRLATEGGHYAGPEDARVSLFQRLCAAPGPGCKPPTYIDVELAAYTRSANFKQKVHLSVDHPNQLHQVSTGLVLSAHDFQSRPPNLMAQVQRMIDAPASRVVKIAYRARSIRDNLELLDLARDIPQQEGGKPVIALGMGEHGLMSRVLAPKFSGHLTFASLDHASATAPGQPTIHDLLGTFRFRSIKRSTKVLGVLGWPVSHSVSPLVHNAGFANINFDAVLLPMPVAPGYEPLKATLLEFLDHPRLDFAGCAVTIPHKEDLLTLARTMRAEGAEGHGADTRWSIDAFAEACGAANTLVVRRDDENQITTIHIANTDGKAAIDALLAHQPDITHLTILGTGGTTRAIAAAALAVGIRVTILSRSADRAEQLAKQLSQQLTSTLRAPITSGPIPTESSPLTPAVEATLRKTHALFNATPVGMKTGPNPGELPIAQSALDLLDPQCLVADAVYAPRITPLLHEAQVRGLRLVTGIEMFIRQAENQFFMWTGHAPPPDLFMHVLSNKQS
jgi:3-dehydroquinate dehydratase / shikimate dehydrogenase